MRLSFPKYPVDLMLCVVWSLILLPLALLDIEGALRVIIGLPFILFIPGYVLMFALFPTREKDRGIDIVERLALSLGLSIAVTALIGLGLNYTAWGIRLESILLSIFGFIVVVGLVAYVRWRQTDPDERFVINVDISLPKSESNLDRALTFILIIAIILVVGVIITLAVMLILKK